MRDVVHLSTAALDRILVQDQPILLDFWAPWCAPCRQQGPALDDLARTHGDRALVAKVNVDEEPQLAARFGVQAVPTLLILRGGSVVQRWAGVQPASVLAAALEGAGA